MAYQTHELKIVCLNDGASMADFTHWLNEIDGVARVHVDDHHHTVSIKIDVYKSTKEGLIDRINNSGKYKVG